MSEKDNEKYTIDNAKNDIQNLQSQNLFDFQEIKRLDSLIKDYDKRILQAINFNNQINKKIQYDYENIKKIIIDENASATLDKKIDDKYNSNKSKIEELQANVSEQLDNKANYNTVWNMVNMGQDIKEAMTGGSVAVVGKNTVLTENIVDKQVTRNKISFYELAKKGNWIVKEDISVGYYYNTNGEKVIDQQAGTVEFNINPSEIYKFNFDSFISYWNNDTFISGYLQPSLQGINKSTLQNIPTNANKVKMSLWKEGFDYAKFTLEEYYTDDLTNKYIDSELLIPYENIINKKNQSEYEEIKSQISSLLDRINLLENNSSKTYSVTYYLNNVISSNNTTILTENSDYSTTLTPYDNFGLYNVTVTVGPVNITDSVYSNGVINISNINGNIIITASAIGIVKCKNAGLASADGLETESTTRIATDFIPVTIEGELTIHSVTTENYKYLVRCYDINKKFIGIGGNEWILDGQPTVFKPFGSVDFAKVKFLRLVYKSKYNDNDVINKISGTIEIEEDGNAKVLTMEYEKEITVIT